MLASPSAHFFGMVTLREEGVAGPPPGARGGAWTEAEAAGGGGGGTALVGRAAERAGGALPEEGKEAPLPLWEGDNCWGNRWGWPGIERLETGFFNWKGNKIWISTSSNTTMYNVRLYNTVSAGFV